MAMVEEVTQSNRVHCSDQGVTLIMENLAQKAKRGSLCFVDVCTYLAEAPL